MAKDINIPLGWVGGPLLVLGLIGLFFYYGSLPSGQHPIERAASVNDAKIFLLVLSWIFSILGLILSIVALIKFANKVRS